MSDIDARVSPSFHPETFSALDAYGTDTAPYISDAVSAFNDAYRTIGKVWDATESGKRNGAWTDDQRVLAVSKVATKEQERLCRRMDLAHANIAKGIEHLERELASPITTKASLQVSGEIRSHCKALRNDGERIAFVRGLIDSGDELSVAAVCGAPAYLSGLNADMAGTFTRMWNERQHPAHSARLSLMRAALDKVQRDGPLLFKELAKAVGAPPQKVRAIDAANERALAALRIEPTA